MWTLLNPIEHQYIRSDLYRICLDNSLRQILRGLEVTKFRNCFDTLPSRSYIDLRPTRLSDITSAVLLIVQVLKKYVYYKFSRNYQRNVINSNLSK